jgi:hypothetical protein
MKFRFRALACAVAVEAVLTVAAAFGGPHGTLGGLPWLLQMPGMLVFLFVPGDRLIALRMTVGLGIQLTIWYFIFSAWFARRERARTPAT